MPHTYIKKATIGTSWGPDGVPRGKGGAGGEVVDAKTMNIVSTMMNEIEQGGEARVAKYCADLDKWTGPILLSKEEIEKKCARVSEQTKKGHPFRRASSPGFCRRAG